MRLPGADRDRLARRERPDRRRRRHLRPAGPGRERSGGPRGARAAPCGDPSNRGTRARRHRETRRQRYSFSSLSRILAMRIAGRISAGPCVHQAVVCPATRPCRVIAACKDLSAASDRLPQQRQVIVLRWRGAGWSGWPDRPPRRPRRAAARHGPGQGADAVGQPDPGPERGQHGNRVAPLRAAMAVAIRA
jgi:hypothetical protein